MTVGFFGIDHDRLFELIERRKLEKAHKAASTPGLCHEWKNTLQISRETHLNIKLVWSRLTVLEKKGIAVGVIPSGEGVGSGRSKFWRLK